MLPPQLAWMAYVWLGLAIASAAAAVILLIIWALLPICSDKPCRWALLLTWQIAIGYGIATLYLMDCCTWTLVVGLISIGIGLILLVWWWVACKESACDVVVELTPVFSAVIALIAYLALFDPLKACLSPIIGAIVGTLSAIFVGLLASCASTGKPSGS